MGPTAFNDEDDTPLQQKDCLCFPSVFGGTVGYVSILMVRHDILIEDNPMRHSKIQQSLISISTRNEKAIGGYA